MTRSTTTPYQNREIDEKFEEIKGSLIRIEAQTVKTNGRVGKLEHWQAYVLGFCACLTAIVIPLTFLVMRYLLLKIL